MASRAIDRRALLGWLATLSACGGGGGGQAPADTDSAPVVVQTATFVDAQSGWGTGTLGGKKTILTTADGGARWRAHDSAITDDVAIVPIDAMRAWAVARTGKVYRSLDGGVTWTEYQADSRDHDAAQVLSPPDPQRILIRYPQVHGFNVVYMRASTDGGVTWYPTTFENAQTVVTRSGVVFQLAQDESKSRLMLQVSTDFGRTSRELALQATHIGALEDGSLWAQVVHSSEGLDGASTSVLALARSSDDGQSWSQADMVIPSIVKPSDLWNFQVEFLSHSGAGWAWAGLGNGPAVFFRTADTGHTWRLALLPAGVSFDQVSVEFSDSSSGWLRTNDGKSAWMTVDSGDHWRPLAVAGEPGLPQAFWRDGGHGLIASFNSAGLADTRLYRSLDEGMNWTRL